MEQDRYDVIIVGAGLAGIVAAHECLLNQQKVLLLDRDSAENFGGLAKRAFGGMCLVDTQLQRRNGIKDSGELAYGDWCSFAEFGEGDHLPMAWARRYCEHSDRHIYQWLLQHGISFLPVVSWAERGLNVRGNSLPRYHVLWGTGQGLVAQLLESTNRLPQRQNLTTKFDCKVSELVFEQGSVVGVVAQHQGEEVCYRAEHTILASGGYNGNLDFVRRHWPADWGNAPERLLNGSHRYADGFLHDKLAQYGAQLTHLDKMWNYAAGIRKPRATMEHEGLSLIPCKSALWFNGLGQRIGPRPLVTGYDTNFLVGQICAQPKGFGWQILNRKIAEKELAISGVEHNPHIREKNTLGFLRDTLFGNKRVVDFLVNDCADVHSANTLDQLLDKIASDNHGLTLNRKALEQSIRYYDAEVARGVRFSNDEQIRLINHSRLWRGDKPRTCFQQAILDPKAGELIAIKTQIISRKSMGGMQTDLYGRVMHANGEFIPGLYASGEAAGFGGGGISGKRSLEGTFLSNCIFNSRVIAYGIKHGSLLGAD